MRNIKYPSYLKERAAELFSLVDSNGNRLYSGKKIAEELGVSLREAYYLEYEGRKMHGYKTIRKYAPRKPTQKEVSSFVERNIYGAESDGVEVRDSLILIALTVVICFTIGTFIINWLINTLV